MCQLCQYVSLESVVLKFVSGVRMCECTSRKRAQDDDDDLHHLKIHAKLESYSERRVPQQFL